MSDDGGNIGNYKGVMLCSRPNELGQPQKQTQEGPPPFNSRVKPAESLGINPPKRVDLPKP
jgi:hypothetical protein